MFPPSDIYIDVDINSQPHNTNVYKESNPDKKSISDLTSVLPPKFIQHITKLSIDVDHKGNVWCYWKPDLDLKIIYDLYYETLKHTFKKNVVDNMEKMKSANTTIKCGNVKVDLNFISVKGTIDFQNQKLLLGQMEKQTHTLKSVFHIQNYVTQKLEFTPQDFYTIKLNVVDFVPDVNMPPIRHIEFYQFH